MLGKTKVDGAQKSGPKLQARNNKWYRYLTQTHLLLFVAMHLILGIYFAFVSTEYANHAGFTGQLDAFRKMGETQLKKEEMDLYAQTLRICEPLEANLQFEQICATICFVLVILWLGAFGTLRKHKEIPALYYVGLVVSAVLPFVYTVISLNYAADAMTQVLISDKTLIVDGMGNSTDIVFWTGVKYGSWANTAEITRDSEFVLDYLNQLGVEKDTMVELAKFDLRGLLAQLREEKHNWDTYELYAILNAVVSAAFMAGAIFFIPLKQSKLAKLFKKK